MKLIMIVGQAGAGKSTAAQFLKKHGCNILETGDIIRERFASESTPGETLLSFSERLFENEGYDLHVSRIARTLYDQALSDRIVSTAVVVGFRTALQVRRLSELFTEAYTLALYASVKTRFTRIKKRYREDDPQSFIEFLREDFRELAWGLDKVMYEAKYYVFNEGTVAALERQLRTLPFLSGHLK